MYFFWATAIQHSTILSLNTSQYLWDYGDGDTSTIKNPIHQYFNNGQYSVKLFASRCDLADSTTQMVNVTTIGVDQTNSLRKPQIWPNPATDIVHIRIDGHNISRITVADISGRIHIVPSVISGDSARLDISTLAPRCTPAGSIQR